MTYQKQLQEHYKAVRARMMKHAIPEKKAPPIVLLESPEKLEPPKAGLVSEVVKNKIVTDALSVTDMGAIYDTAQALKLAEEMVNSPRLPPIPGLVINEIGAIRWLRILHAVANKHGVEKADIMGKSRRRAIVEARFEVFYRLRIDLSFSYLKIAHLMKKDHTTVLHGVNTLRKRLLDERSRMAEDAHVFSVNYPDQNTHTNLSAA